MSGSPAEGFQTHFVRDQKSLDLGICGLAPAPDSDGGNSSVPLGYGSELRNSPRTCLAPKPLRFWGDFQSFPEGWAVSYRLLQFWGYSFCFSYRDSWRSWILCISSRPEAPYSGEKPALSVPLIPHSMPERRNFRCQLSMPRRAPAASVPRCESTGRTRVYLERFMAGVGHGAKSSSTKALIVRVPSGNGSDAVPAGAGGHS